MQEALALAWVEVGQQLVLAGADFDGGGGEGGAPRPVTTPDPRFGCRPPQREEQFGVAGSQGSSSGRPSSASPTSTRPSTVTLRAYGVQLPFGAQGKGGSEGSADRPPVVAGSQQG